MPDEATLKWYTSNASELCGRYHQAQPLYLEHLVTLLPNKGTRILDVGAGCGRDVAGLRQRGYNAIGVDACAEMVYAGRRQYGLSDRELLVDQAPELAALGAITGQPVKPFDAVICAATLQHIAETDLLDTLFKLKTLLAPGGFLIVSVPSSYPVNQSSDGLTRDGNGRLFLLRPAEQYKFFLERLGLTQTVSFESLDELGRPDITWRTLVFTRGSTTELKPVETIESVLWDDRKVNTYKFALIRALCHLATHRYNGAAWHHDGRVSIPVDAVALLWLQYYWPIAASSGDDFILQGQKFKDQSRSDMSFRSPLRELALQWESQGGYPAFRAAHDAGRLPAPSRALLKSTLARLRSAIQQPIRYAGNSQTGKDLFSYSRGRVFLPEGIWTELALMGRWIEDSVTLRWAQFTADLLQQNPAIGFTDVLQLLIRSSSDERETALARTSYEQYSATNQLECAWTGRRLERFDVDHAIPWSLWRNNDLWNLLPVHPSANNQKRDRLPARDRIVDRQQAIISSWSILFETHPRIFLSHASAFCGEPLHDFAQPDRRLLFSTFKDAVEYTAVNRGIGRW